MISVYFVMLLLVCSCDSYLMCASPARVSFVVLEYLFLYFGGKCIVDDLLLRIVYGDWIGFIGLNGSGKMMLLCLIAGDQYFDGGSIWMVCGARVGWLL